MIRILSILILGLALFSCKSGEKGLSVLGGKSSEDELIQADMRFIEAAKEKNTGNTKKAKELYLSLLKSPGDKAPIHYELSLIYHHEGDYDNAQDQILKAIVIDDSTDWYLQHYVRINKAQRYWDHVEKGYEKLVKCHPDDAEFLIEYSDYFISRQKYDEALELYKRIERLIGVSERVNKNAYLIYRQKEMRGEALNELKKLNAAFEDNPKFYVDIANHFVENKQFDSAKVYINKGFEVLPNHPVLHVGLGDIYFFTDDFPKAKVSYIKAIEDEGYGLSKKRDILEQYFPIAPINKQRQEELIEMVQTLEKLPQKGFDTYDFTGKIYFQNGFYKDAQRNLEKAVFEKKKAYDTWEILFQTDFNLKEYTTMKSHVDEAISYYPMQPRFYYFKGIAENKLNNKKQAIKAFERAEKLVIDDDELKGQIYSALGDLYHETQMYKKSDEAFAKALQVDPNNPYTLNNYAYYLSLRNTQLDIAQKYSKQTIQMAPSNPSFLDTYGWIMYQKGEYEEALKFLELAEKNTQEASTEIIEHIAETYAKLGDPKKAIEYFEKAIAAGADKNSIQLKIEALK